ncbi:MAG TPA: response regulator transcription factor, partial [bacterium]|nr:response regulator transcription factor [bacterium]
RPSLVQLSLPSRPDVPGGPETQARYWRRRLLMRRYTEGLRAHLTGELSARIEHAGESHYFPLGTADERAAAHRAAEIYRALLASGWPFVRQTFAREITVAVFWATNPLACTYATVFTEPTEHDTQPRRQPGGDPAGLVCIVDGDEGVRRAVTSCVAIQLNGWDVATLSTAEELLWMSARFQRALVFLNRNLPDMAGGECVEKLRARYPEIPAFTYGIYDESDRLFLSFAGVSGGYILRRRPPAHLLEPIGPLAMMRACSPDQLAHRVRRYFQSFFGAMPVRDITAMARLTPREQDVLEYISKGYIDREIAKRLGISAWTVHGHLQSIFRKLDVHTRTEAVVTYLQK